MKSLSEIETISKRATRAAGFSWGIAEEVGKCIRLLELFSFPGIQNLNKYFHDKNKNTFSGINKIKKNNFLKKKIFCPIKIGVSFLDQINNFENIKKCNFKKVAYPLLLLPFLSRASESIGKKILFSFDNNKFLLNFNLNIASSGLKKKFPPMGKKIEITFLENSDNFSSKDWKNLYKLSEETFVRETESLKQGAAGAGLTDND